MGSCELGDASLCLGPGVFVFSPAPTLGAACAILNAIDHEGHDTMNAYVVLRSKAEVERVLTLNGKVRKQ